jgi:uncharacterized RDD family membrane protein YckC
VTTVERRTVTGHYAGAASRAAAGAVDIAVVLGVYTLAYSGLLFLDQTFFGDRFNLSTSGVLGVITLLVWAFLYVYVSLAVAGRTAGKGLIGLRVLTSSGAAISSRTAFVRTLAEGLSVLILFLGFLGIVFGRRHRALHDVIAHTCVVYDWGVRSAQLPGPLTEFLSRHGA